MLRKLFVLLILLVILLLIFCSDPSSSEENFADNSITGFSGKIANWETEFSKIPGYESKVPVLKDFVGSLSNPTELFTSVIGPEGKFEVELGDEHPAYEYLKTVFFTKITSISSGLSYSDTSAIFDILGPFTVYDQWRNNLGIVRSSNSLSDLINNTRSPGYAGISIIYVDRDVILNGNGGAIHCDNLKFKKGWNQFIIEVSSIKNTSNEWSYNEYCLIYKPVNKNSCKWYLY
ncbi:hypothetical protein JW835_06025 [bacterium]|nr:hypothetical protein [bacterium]